MGIESLFEICEAINIWFHDMTSNVSLVITRKLDKLVLRQNLCSKYLIK